MSTKYTMLGGISGTRNGVDWPKPGQPAPADLTKREIDRLTEARIIAEIDTPAGDVETAQDSTPVETATTKRRRAKAAATTED